MNPTAVDKIASQIAEFRETLATARTSRDALEQRAAEIQAAPPTREMVRDRVMNALEARTSSIEERVDNVLRWSIAARPEEFAEGFHTNLTIPLMHHDPAWLLAILWPHLLAALDAKIASMEWPPNAALSAEDKAAQLAALEPQRQAARAAVEQLEAQGAKLGIA